MYALACTAPTLNSERRARSTGVCRRRSFYDRTRKWIAVTDKENKSLAGLNGTRDQWDKMQKQSTGPREDRTWNAGTGGEE